MPWVLLSWGNRWPAFVLILFFVLVVIYFILCELLISLFVLMTSLKQGVVFEWFTRLLVSRIKDVGDFFSRKCQGLCLLCLILWWAVIISVQVTWGLVSKVWHAFELITVVVEIECYLILLSLILGLFLLFPWEVHFNVFLGLTKLHCSKISIAFINTSLSWCLSLHTVRQLSLVLWQ